MGSHATIVFAGQRIPCIVSRPADGVVYFELSEPEFLPFRFSLQMHDDGSRCECEIKTQRGRFYVAYVACTSSSGELRAPSDPAPGSKQQDMDIQLIESWSGRRGGSLKPKRSTTRSISR